LQDTPGELIALADHVAHRHEELVRSWQRAVQRDPQLSEGDSLPRTELIDHIPALLAAFERSLRQAATLGTDPAHIYGEAAAAAHGLERWKQGYNLREVARELGKLNEAVVLELSTYPLDHAAFSIEGLRRAQQIWTVLYNTCIEESVSQYFAMQQQEAAGHVKDLESALEQIRELEQQRGEVWQQAAHDLRGNLSVVANVTVGLTRPGPSAAFRDDFVRILMRNVTSLHHLLDDVTGLARLQAGSETRRIEPLDVTTLIQALCEGIRPLAAQRGLYLVCQGPDGLATDGDAVKIRRIAQNLILNAVKYTHEGGITVSWGDSGAEDQKRWVLSVADTGPGFHTASGKPLAAALDAASEPAAQASPAAGAGEGAGMRIDPSINATKSSPAVGEPGEGIGLSIVKRLCEMLDATIEIQSVVDVGTIFRVFFPRHYNSV
jgi:signal transduction histidine kinase